MYGGLLICDTLQMRKLEGHVWGAFLQWIRDEAARQGLSITALGEKAGVDGSTISRWDKGTDGPRLGNVAQVADALDIPVARLTAVIDHALGTGEEPRHTSWPRILDAIENAPDLVPHEKRALRRSLDLIRDAVETGGESRART